jgi:hypothetical protein
MSAPIRTSLSVFADYSQFYLTDPEHVADWSDLWTDETVGDRLVATAHTVVFGTDRNFTVPVNVLQHSAEPAIADLAATADHAVLCGITLLASSAKIAGCTEYLPTAPSITIGPGTFGVLYAAHRLATVDGLDGDDSYDIHLWPTTTPPTTRVLKRLQPGR